MRRALLSWRLKLFLLVSLFAVIPVLVISYWSWDSQRRSLRSAQLEALHALATAKAAAVEQFSIDRVRDVERISTLLGPRLEKLATAQARSKEPHGPANPQPLPDVANDTTVGAGTGTPSGDGGAPRVVNADALPADGATAPDAGGATAAARAKELADAREALQRALALILWDQSEFEELLVIDDTGIVVASTFDDHVGMTAESLEYFEQGRRATFLQPVFLSPISNQQTIVVATPMRRGEDGKEIGVLAARLNLTRFFRLIGDATGLGETGETVVGKKVDDRILFMAPTRHDADAAFTRAVTSGGRQSRALQEAARGQEGAGGFVDYRGVAVLGSWQHLPSLDWGLVVKVDEREAMRDAREARDRILGFAVVVIAAALLASMLATRALIKPLRELKDATDKISRGDFGVRLDIRSRVEIGELADSFERMVAAIKFFRERADRAPADDDDDDLLDDEDPGAPPRAE